MKKSQLKGLIFREVYGNRKSYISCALLFFGISAFMILVQLSLKIGNLAKLSEHIGDFKSYLTPMMIYMPVLMAGYIGSAEQVSVRDCKKNWLRFQYTTPVSEFGFSLVRYLCMLVGTLAGYLLALLHTAVICGMSGTPFDYTMLSAVTALVIVALLFNAIFGVLIQLFGSIEKAGILMLGVCMGAALVFFKNANPNESDAIAEKLTKLSETLLPFMPIIFIAILALGCGLSTLVLKRREK